MKTQISLYNSETGKKEILKTNNEPVLIYACGPTIYDFAHIGNFRTYVFEDLLRRTLQFFNIKVEQAMNITDVDDKTIRNAIRKNVSLKAYVEPFRIAFFDDLKQLNIQPVEHYPAATDYIQEMIDLISLLVSKGFAYQVASGSVYYKISQFSSYGRLSRIPKEQIEKRHSGICHEADEYDKEDVSDFVLWKAYEKERDGDVYWESPFGRGRPGWHIECSAMAMATLGKTIDIHCGGVDNAFPHHENEIAQSEGATGCCFARHWVHVEHLLVDHKKMSKALGNFYTFRDLLKKGYTGVTLRYLLLSVHYRTQLNFTFASLNAARMSLQRIEDFIARLRSVRLKKPIDQNVQEIIQRADLRFRSALADDINISVALASIFELIREMNILGDEDRLGIEEAEAILNYFHQWNQVLAIFPFDESEIPEEVKAMLVQREEARMKKNFQMSDQMRDAIQARGFLIEDTTTGVRLKKR